MLPSGADGPPRLALKVPETVPQEKRIQQWLAVYFVGVEAEKQMYGSHTGDGSDEILELARQFHLDSGHLPPASPRATGQPKRYGLEEVDFDKVADELRALASPAQARVRQDKESALDKPYHLFFFSAVDRDERIRFFDIMKQEDGFTLAETCTTAPRLSACVESVYEVVGAGRFHHAHRIYGKYRTDTARSAMEFFAKANSLTHSRIWARLTARWKPGPHGLPSFRNWAVQPTTSHLKNRGRSSGKPRRVGAQSAFCLRGCP